MSNKTFTRILLPTDFSDAARNAGVYAAGLAAQFQAELHVFHCMHLPAAVHTGAYFDAEVKERMRQEVIERLEKRAAELRAIHPELTVQVHMAFGELEEELPAFAEKLAASLLVMGTEGTSGLKRLIGSNTYRTIRQAPCPVLSVPAQAKYLPIGKILFACDYARLQNPAVLSLLNDFARDLKANVQIVNINEAFELSAAPQLKANPGVEAYLHTEARCLEFAENVASGVQLRDYLEEQRIDLLFMLPRHHNFIERLFGGDITQRMVYHPAVPLLTVRENQLQSV